MNYIIALFYSVLFSLSIQPSFALQNDQPVKTTFSVYPVTTALTNGLVIGKVVSDYVTLYQNAHKSFGANYPMSGQRVLINPPGYTLCTTNIDGLGVQFFNFNGIKENSCVGFSTDIFQSVIIDSGNKLNINRELLRFVIYDASKFAKGGNFSVTSLSTSWYYGGDILGGSVVLNQPLSFTFPAQKNEMIFFPEYPMGNPAINLPFKIGGNGYQNLYASAEKKIQMCLADDNSTNSSQFQLTFTDASNFPGAGEIFHLNRQGGSGENHDHVDYQLSIKNPLTYANEAIASNIPIIWTNVNNNTVKTVTYNINGKSQSCVPTPLSIKVPTFNYSSKTSGVYSGAITILFTPSLNN